MDFHFYLHFHCHLLDSDIFIKEWESENISIFPSVTTWYFVNWIDRGYFSKERLTNGFFYEGRLSDFSLKFYQKQN